MPTRSVILNSDFAAGPDSRIADSLCIIPQRHSEFRLRRWQASSQQILQGTFRSVILNSDFAAGRDSFHVSTSWVSRSVILNSDFAAGDRENLKQLARWPAASF